jgi:hypothetical protein
MFCGQRRFLERWLTQRGPAKAARSFRRRSSMDCFGNPPLLNNQIEERVESPSQGPFRGSRPKASPTRPSVSEAIEEECVLLLPDRGGSLKRLHRPNLLGLDCMGFKEHQSFKIFYGHQP